MGQLGRVGIGRYSPRADVVADYIRAAIVDGRLSAGAPIGQEEIACQLGTSRIPIAEALRRLELEGLVTVAPHGGARVAVLDFAEYTELYRIREAIEPMVLAHSAEWMTEARLARLREEAAKVAGAAADPLAWLDHDRRFHLESYAEARMPRALELIERFWNQTQQYRRAYFYSVRDRLSVVTLEHDLLVDALERRDGDAAASLLRSHLRRTRSALDPEPGLFSAPAAPA